jgi:hypothetical protein
LQHIKIIQLQTKSNKVLAFATRHSYYLAMKKRYICLSLVLVLSVITTPQAWAADDVRPPAPVLITEIQPGTAASASQEFIEIYNASRLPIDLTAGAWQLQITSSAATTWESPLRTIPLAGVLGAGHTLVAAAKYTSGGVSVQYLADSVRASFSPGVTAAAGHIRLGYTTRVSGPGHTCVDAFRVVDEVEWSRGTAGVPTSPSLDGRSVYAADSNGIGTAYSLQRRVTPDMQFADTEDDNADFLQVTSTPGSVPQVPLYDALLVSSTCSVTPEPSNEPSEPPSPPTDIGSDGDPDPPADPQPEAPTDPTPGEQLPSDPTPQTNAGLLAPRITELLPNPAAPQSDDTDEFVELYNPNDSAFDISGFVLEVGLTTKHRYVFPDGTQLAAVSWAVFYARDTGLSLSNSGGAARLFDTANVAVSAVDPYGAAAEGQAWAYDAGVWQWTTTPTPGAPNVVMSLPMVIKKTVATAAVKKPVAVKAAATKAPKQQTTKAAKQPKASKTQTAAMAPVAAERRNPLHIGVLAAVGSFAILYGAYEYRSDIANKLHQLRRYRADRRKDRPRAKGR